MDNEFNIRPITGWGWRKTGNDFYDIPMEVPPVFSIRHAEGPEASHLNARWWLIGTAIAEAQPFNGWWVSCMGVGDESEIDLVKEGEQPLWIVFCEVPFTITNMTSPNKWDRLEGLKGVSYSGFGLFRGRVAAQVRAAAVYPLAK